ncbi:hypothetical protein [Arthrobacter humicola]
MTASTLIRTATTSFRWLAYAGAASGIVAILVSPARVINELLFAFMGIALLLALALVVVFLIAPEATGITGTVGTLRRPTGRQVRIVLGCLLLPLSMEWSFAVFFIICNGLILSGLAILIGYALAPDGVAAGKNPGTAHHEPALRLRSVFNLILDTTNRSLSEYTAGEVAAHADLVGRKGRIKIDRRTNTAAVIARDGYRATYRLNDGTRLPGTPAN